jgi:hypothetical protein
MSYIEPQAQSLTVNKNYQPPSYYMDDTVIETKTIKILTPIEKYDFEAEKIRK